MSIFFMPALLSLLFKFYFFITVIRGGKVSIVFLSLVAIFAVHNAIELFGYILLFTGNNIELLFRPYYVITIYLLMYILLHGLKIAKINHYIVNTIIISAATLLSSLVIFTDSIVSGYYLTSYSVTATEGNHYWAFAAYLLIALSSTVLALLYSFKRAKTTLDSDRCLYSLYALSPIILAFLLTIICKLTGVEFNAAAIVPIATTLFLLIVLTFEPKHQLSDIRKLMPMSLEKETTSNFMAILDFYIKHQNNEDAFKTAQSNIEKELIFFSLKKCNYNVSKTTKMMGLKNRSTLYSMMNRLEIDIKGIKKDFLA